MESWKNLEGIKTCELFAEKLEYFENPIDLPCTKIEDVKKLWEIVPQNQKDISYNFEILSADEEKCIVNFKMKRTLIATNQIQNIDGIFEIKLNKKEKLKYFKQWRFVK